MSSHNTELCGSVAMKVILRVKAVAWRQTKMRRVGQHLTSGLATSAKKKVALRDHACLVIASPSKYWSVRSTVLLLLKEDVLNTKQLGFFEAPPLPESLQDLTSQVSAHGRGRHRGATKGQWMLCWEIRTGMDSNPGKFVKAIDMLHFKTVLQNSWSSWSSKKRSFKVNSQNWG